MFIEILESYKKLLSSIREKVTSFSVSLFVDKPNFAAARDNKDDAILLGLFLCRVASTPWRNPAMMVLDTLALFLNLRLCV